MEQHELSEQEQIRRDSLKELKQLGINPFPAEEYPVSHYSQDLLDNFEGNEDQYQEVCLAGRIMTLSW